MLEQDTFLYKNLNIFTKWTNIFEWKVRNSLLFTSEELINKLPQLHIAIATTGIWKIPIQIQYKFQ